MFRFISTFLAILLISICCFGQTTKRKNISKYKVKASQPSIYITFIKKEKRLNADSDEEDLIWLKLYNNTKWEIALQASGGFGKTDATLYYSVLDQDQKLIRGNFCHICSIIRISSGRSILFGVWASELKGSSYIKIRYTNEWEDFFNNSEPTHSIYFDTKSL